MNIGSIFSFLNKKNDSVLGIDIGSSAIKIVQLKKKKGRAILETYGELALGPYAGVEVGRSTNLERSKLVEALNDVLKESNTTTKASATTIPLTSSFITFIKMPAIEGKQLAEMIPIEARKYIPVPISEVMLDWWVIPKENKFANENSNGPAGASGTNGSKNVKPLPKGPPAPATPMPREDLDVLVVVIHNEALEKYQQITARAGLESSFTEIEIFSTIRAALEQGVESQMILDLGASTAKLYIIEHGILRNSHTINRGSQDITLAISKSLSMSVVEAENLKRAHGLKGGPELKDLTETISLNLDYIFYESNRVLLNYQKKFNKNVTKIILTGGGVLLKGFKELASSSFQTEVVLCDPFSKVETPAFLSEVLKQAGPEFAVAVGSALRKLGEIK